MLDKFTLRREPLRRDITTFATTTGEQLRLFTNPDCDPDQLSLFEETYED